MVYPEAVKICLEALKKEGFQGYAVGGCVRDSLLGLTPEDYDICTDALPEDTSRIFRAYPLVRSGEKHGTIGVVMEGSVYEITTFRQEGGYRDSRHPDWVRFVGDIKEDLARRDFTINAMACSPESGLCDPFGGQKDLKDRILRAVGDPDTRFTEDALRILRGVRFAVRFGLTPEKATLEAMFRQAHRIRDLAGERVFSELCKLLPGITGEQIHQYFPILREAIPELAPMEGFQQHTPHHRYDVLCHTTRVVEAMPRDLTLRWAVLLHDVGKPRCFTMDPDGRGHFKGHAAVGGEMAREILTRLRAPTLLREDVVFLIEHHMSYMEPDRMLLKRRLSRYGRQRTMWLLDLQQGDFAGKGVGTPEEAGIFHQTRQMLEEILAEKPCLGLKELALSGSDLLELGYTPGVTMGQCLRELLGQVLEERIPNEKTALIGAAKEFYLKRQEDIL